MERRVVLFNGIFIFTAKREAGMLSNEPYYTKQTWKAKKESCFPWDDSFGWYA